METDSDVKRLLQDILEAQREHIRVYKDYIERALQTQEQAIRRQILQFRIWITALIVAAVLVATLLSYLPRLAK